MDGCGGASTAPEARRPRHKRKKAIFIPPSRPPCQSPCPSVRSRQQGSETCIPNTRVLLIRGDVHMALERCKRPFNFNERNGSEILVMAYLPRSPPSTPPSKSIHCHLTTDTMPSKNQALALIFQINHRASLKEMGWRFYSLHQTNQLDCPSTHRRLSLPSLLSSPVLHSRTLIDLAVPSHLDLQV